MLEDVTVLALHQVDVVLSQLKGGFLEVHVPRRTWKHETEVDVNDMPVDIDQNIVVMAVFDVEEVGDKTVASQGLDKVHYGCLPVKPEHLFVDIAQIAFSWGLLQERDGPGVVDELDQPAVGTVGNDRVGLDPYFYVLLCEDLIDKRDQLHRHVLLSQIVPALDHVALDPMAFDFAKDRLLAEVFLRLTPLTPEVGLR